MKTFLKSLKRQDGFTLVELMVVVAIIGLLSAVAVPNFKKYQAKAKMSEAKLQLSALYTAETSFYSDYNIYHHCLTYMGFDPGPESANRYYATGFTLGMNAINAAAYTAAGNSGLNGAAGQCPNVASATAGAVAAPSPNDASWFPAGKGIGANIANTNAHISTTVMGDQSTSALMTFTAGAGGIIDGAAASILAATCSRLTITNNKVIAVTSNGF